MARFTVPGQNEPLVDPRTGLINPVWFPLFKFFEQLQPLSDIDNPPFTVAPLTPGSTSAAVTTRTVTDTDNSTAGVDPGGSPVSIGYNVGATNTLFHSFTKIKNMLNAIYTNITNLATAVGALSTRVTALENKENDVISDLDARFP